MADGDISLLAIYDRVGGVDSKVEALTARVDEQLAHGARKLDDHEDRIRWLKDRVPEDLPEQLEQARDDRSRRRGMGTVGQIFLTLTGSAVTGGLVDLLLNGVHR